MTGPRSIKRDVEELEEKLGTSLDGWNEIDLARAFFTAPEHRTCTQRRILEIAAESDDVPGWFERAAVAIGEDDVGAQVESRNGQEERGA